MALAPDLKNQVNEAPATGAKLIVPDDNSGQIIAGAGVRFGAAVGKAGEAEDDIRLVVDQAKAKEADTNFVVGLNDTEIEYLNMKKGDAVDAYEEVDRLEQKRYEDTLAGFSNDRQRALWQDSGNRQLEASRGRRKNHYNRQALEYDMDQSAARAATQLDTSVRLELVGDARGAAEARATYLSEIVYQGGRTGAAPEEIERGFFEGVSGSYVQVAEGLAKDDPLAAYAFVAKNGANMTSGHFVDTTARMQPAWDQAIVERDMDAAMDTVFGSEYGVGADDSGVKKPLAVRLGLSGAGDPTQPVPATVAPGADDGPDQSKPAPPAAAPAKPKTNKFAADPKYAKTVADPLRGRGAVPKGGRWGDKREGTRKHTGQDLAAPKGTPVTPPRPGKVIQVNAGTQGRSGRFIIVDHGNGVVSSYSHLSAVSVKVGDDVHENTIIGAVGGSGNGKENGYGNHLHYGLRVGGPSGNRVNPDGFDWAKYDAGGYTGGGGEGAAPPAPTKDTTYKPNPRYVDPNAYDEAHQQADAIADERQYTPNQRKAAHRYVDSRYQKSEQQQQRYEASANDEVMGIVNDIEAGGGRMTDPASQIPGFAALPVSVQMRWRSYGEGQQREEQAAADRVQADADRAQAQRDRIAAASTEGQRDEIRAETVGYLETMATSTDPVTRGRYLELNIPVAYAGVLTPSQVTSATARQARARQEGLGGSRLNVAPGTAREYLRLRAGALPKTLTTSEENVMVSGLMVHLNARQEKENRVFSPVEIQAETDAYLNTQFYQLNEGGWFGDPAFGDKPVSRVKAVDDGLPAVPVSWRAQYKRNFPGATDAQVYEAYRKQQ